MYELRGWDVEKVVLNGLKTNFEHFGFHFFFGGGALNFGSKNNFEFFVGGSGDPLLCMNILVGLK